MKKKKYSIVIPLLCPIRGKTFTKREQETKKSRKETTTQDKTRGTTRTKDFVTQKEDYTTRTKVQWKRDKCLLSLFLCVLWSRGWRRYLGEE